MSRWKRMAGVKRARVEEAQSTPPDRIIREIPLIERYSRHNESEDVRFRTYLKVRLDQTSEETDAIVRKTTDEIWSQIDCTKCAHCCKTMQVAVDATDVKRLAARLGITPQKFSRRYTKVDEYRERWFAKSPCEFLGEDNCCTIYEDRPKACRDFPYLHSDHFVGRTMMMISNTSRCPIVFNVWQALKVRLGFRRSR